MCIFYAYNTGDARVVVEWDPDKAVSNLRKHGIRFSDVETVFFDDHAVSIPDSLSVGEDRFFLVAWIRWAES